MADFLVVAPGYRSSSRAAARCLRELVCQARVAVVEPPADIPNVNHARTVLANEALAEPEAVQLWVDDDMIWRTEQALQLVEQCTEKTPIVGADYAVKRMGSGQTAARWSCSVTFGDGGALQEAEQLGFGFVAVHRCVFEAMAQHLPPVTLLGERTVHPFFVSAPDESFGDYPSSDVAFCRLAKRLGFPVACDTSLLIRHEGTQQFRVQDAYTPLPPDTRKIEVRRGS